MRLKALLFVLVLFVTGCSTTPQRITYEPIVDRDGWSAEGVIQYNYDHGQCKTYAREISPTKRSLGSLLAGAAFGALLGSAMYGSAGADAGRGAAIGSVSGGTLAGAYGMRDAFAEQAKVLRNCLQGRGYSVLN